MAALYYILCDTCGGKVVYDGDYHGRDMLEQDSGVKALTCPQCVEKLRASYTSLLQWLQGQGLLVRYAMCTKPDNTVGPAWVLRSVSAVDGDSCLGWGDDPLAAVDSALKL